jgi:hypothetical protein
MQDTTPTSSTHRTNNSLVPPAPIKKKILASVRLTEDYVEEVKKSMEALSVECQGLDEDEKKDIMAAEAMLLHPVHGVRKINLFPDQQDEQSVADMLHMDAHDDELFEFIEDTLDNPLLDEDTVLDELETHMPPNRKRKHDPFEHKDECFMNYIAQPGQGPLQPVCRKLEWDVPWGYLGLLEKSKFKGEVEFSWKYQSAFFVTCEVPTGDNNHTNFHQLLTNIYSTIVQAYNDDTPSGTHISVDLE